MRHRRCPPSLHTRLRASPCIAGWPLTRAFNTHGLALYRRQAPPSPACFSSHQPIHCVALCCTGFWLLRLPAPLTLPLRLPDPPPLTTVVLLNSRRKPHTSAHLFVSSGLPTTAGAFNATPSPQAGSKQQQQLRDSTRSNSRAGRTAGRLWAEHSLSTFMCRGGGHTYAAVSLPV